MCDGEGLNLETALEELANASLGDGLREVGCLLALSDGVTGTAVCVPSTPKEELPFAVAFEEGMEFGGLL